MDVSEKPGNSIEVIERFVLENCADLKEYHNSVLPNQSCVHHVFPPGHKLRIKNFVVEAIKKFGQEETKKPVVNKGEKHKLNEKKPTVTCKKLGNMVIGN